MIAHGITGLVSQYMGVVYDVYPIPKQYQQRIAQGERVWITHKINVEMAGSLRYALAFLATLNDAPVTRKMVQPSGTAYFARGKYRKYLEHTVLTLKLPAKKDPRAVARRLVAQARRRAHQVRGHWRLYQRGDGVLWLPSAHNWGPPDAAGHAKCHNCTAWRTWITEHNRGNDREGFVIHDYNVTH